jgi:hypothetical protein
MTGDVVGSRQSAGWTIGEVDVQALAVRNLTYALFVELGRAPSAPRKSDWRRI